MNVNPYRETYYNLALKLLQVDELPPSPLGLSGSRWDYENNRPFPRRVEPPGGVDEKTEERIIIEVCRLVPGLTAQYLAGRDEEQRLPYLEAAIEARDNSPSPPTPAEPVVPSPVATIDDSNWPTQQTVATGFDVSSMTIDRWVDRGKLRSNGKDGKAKRIDPASVLELLQKDKKLVYKHPR